MKAIHIAAVVGASLLATTLLPSALTSMRREVRNELQARVQAQPIPVQTARALTGQQLTEYLKAEGAWVRSCLNVGYVGGDLLDPYGVLTCDIPAQAPSYSCLNLGGTSMCDPDNNGHPAYHLTWQRRGVQ